MSGRGGRLQPAERSPAQGRGLYNKHRVCRTGLGQDPALEGPAPFLHLDQHHGVVRAKRPRRLPVVLSREEVRVVFSSLDGVPLLV